MAKTLQESSLGVRQCVPPVRLARLRVAARAAPVPHLRAVSSSRTPFPSLPLACSMQLRDVSGGCGAQFALHIVADAFEGVPLVRQQRLVNEALKDYLKTVHSLTMQTVAPSKWGGAS